ncbi:MAG: DUF3540 domain-containing protein, partial [Myxococcales bacterium]|nr:DUF3540 domain-containing protein [Myxococcales bacterium]
MRALDHSTNDDVIQEVGAVRAVEDGRLVVHTGGSTFRCKRAVSCLVEPQIDDVVLFAGRSSG